MDIVVAKKSYSTQYKTPITLEVGEMVQLGNEEVEEKWRGWIWAETNSNKGWVPIQNLDISIDRKTGTAIKSYTARELDVEQGDSLEKIESLNGWTWSKNLRTNETGWIPDEVFQNMGE